jgi:KDO2-lipid IV(A) lauroyltransferase
VDVLARKFNFPVFYYHVQRLRRGFYDVHYSEICLKPADAEATAITQAFANKLEAIIKDQPENWLWSHKRWKMKPEG